MSDRSQGSHGNRRSASRDGRSRNGPRSAQLQAQQALLTAELANQGARELQQRDLDALIQQRLNTALQEAAIATDPRRFIYGSAASPRRLSLAGQQHELTRRQQIHPEGHSPSRSSAETNREQHRYDLRQHRPRSRQCSPNARDEERRYDPSPVREPRSISRHQRRANSQDQTSRKREIQDRLLEEGRLHEGSLLEAETRHRKEGLAYLQAERDFQDRQRGCDGWLDEVYVSIVHPSARTHHGRTETERGDHRSGSSHDVYRQQSPTIRLGGNEESDYEAQQRQAATAYSPRYISPGLSGRPRDSRSNSGQDSQSSLPRGRRLNSEQSSQRALYTRDPRTPRVTYRWDPCPNVPGHAEVLWGGENLSAIQARWINRAIHCECIVYNISSEEVRLQFSWLDSRLEPLIFYVVSSSNQTTCYNTSISSTSTPISISSSTFPSTSSRQTKTMSQLARSLSQGRR